MDSLENTGQPLPFCDTTLLATDFLNQYNEITMALSLIPSAPDMIDDFLDWVPKSYEVYFAQGPNRDKEAILNAYNALPALKKNTFDALVDHLNVLALEKLRGINSLISQDVSSTQLTLECEQALADLSHSISQLADMVHGTSGTGEQAAIDALFAD